MMICRSLLTWVFSVTLTLLGGWSAAVRGAIVSGKVTYEEGTPVPGVHVKFTDEADARRVFRSITDSEGAYRVLLEQATDRETEEQVTPVEFELLQNYPNPFNASTVIPYRLKTPAQVRLTVYNVLGQHVRTLVDEHQEAGPYRTVWDGRDNRGMGLGAGVYLYRMEAGTYVETRKMVMMDGAVGGSPSPRGTATTAPKATQASEERFYTVSIDGAYMLLFLRKGICVTEDVRLDFVVKRPEEMGWTDTQFSGELDPYLQGEGGRLVVRDAWILDTSKNWALGASAFDDRGNELTGDNAVTDGTIETEWNTRTSKVKGKYVVVDLGKDIAIGRVTILGGMFLQKEPDFYIKGYRISLASSDDPGSWEVVAEQPYNANRNVDTAEDRTWLETDDYGFALPKTSRYVKVEITRGDGSNWVVIGEIGVSGGSQIASGYYTSNPQKLGKRSRLQVDWVADLPDGTGIALEFRSGTNAWSSDWEGASVLQLEAPTGSYVLDNSTLRYGYIQYRAYLKRSSTNLTPALNSVVLSWEVADTDQETLQEAMDRGTGFLELKDYDSAKENFLDALAEAPDDHEAHFCLALAYARSDEREEAIAEYKELLALHAAQAHDQELIDWIARFVGLDRYEVTCLTSNRRPASSASFPPDGTQIVFTLDQTERPWYKQIYVMDCDGSNQRCLTSSQVHSYWPSFSPDGREIVFTRYEGFWGIWVMNSDGSNQRRLTSSETESYIVPSFSPDGTQILYGVQQEEDWGIYMMDADGSNQRRLSPSDARDSFPSFSPDGTQIVFMFYWQEDSSGEPRRLKALYEIHIMDSDGSDRQRLTSNDRHNYYPSFSPDGAQIVFVSRMGGNFDLYTMAADGSDVCRLTFSQMGQTQPSFSPDGTKIIYTSRPDWDNEQGEAEVYVMDLTKPVDRAYLAKQFAVGH